RARALGMRDPLWLLSRGGVPRGLSAVPDHDLSLRARDSGDRLSAGIVVQRTDPGLGPRRILAGPRLLSAKGRVCSGELGAVLGRSVRPYLSAGGRLCLAMGTVLGGIPGRRVHAPRIHPRDVDARAQ